MSLRRLGDASGLVHQSSGDPHSPPVVYLPGVHGDWTAQSRVRCLLSDSFHFVETAYPWSETWSIDDFARALKELLDRLGIESAHIVGESFGSLVGWQFGIVCPERIRSFTLVGGFCRAPRFAVAAAAAATLRVVPAKLFESAVDLYVAGKSAMGEHREVFELGAYPASRTERGQRATARRMEIIQGSDFRGKLQTVRFPVRYVAGARDIVVPVRREIATLNARLSQRCDFQSELISGAAHMLIASHPGQTASSISKWVRDVESTWLNKVGYEATDEHIANPRND